MPLDMYMPAGLAIAFALGFCVLFLALAKLIGPRHVTPTKLQPFECGSEPAAGSPHAAFSVKFYQIAILFLIFDIESAFMYPWAVLFRDLSTSPTGATSLFGFVEMFLFVVVLLVALTYVWRKKAIGWD